MLSSILSLALLAAAAQVSTEVGDGPEPAPVLVAWQLEFEFLSEPLRIDVPGSGTYWYMVYRVTNPEPRTQNFFPIIEVVTADMRVIPTDMGISPAVFAAIKKRHAQVFPYLVSPNKVLGPLQTGADYARESVAIWRDVDLTSSEFKIYVAGLSGESRLVPNPAYDPAKPESGPRTGERAEGGNPRHFTIRKTLEIRYTLPGSFAGRAQVAPVRTETRWVMR